MAALGLHWCEWAFSSCSDQGLLLAVASLIVEHGLQVLGLQQLQHVGSVVVTQGSSCPAILLFLLCWQVDSLPLSHQKRPSLLGFTLSDLSVQQLPSLPQKLGRQTRNCSFSAMLLHVPHSCTAVTDKQGTVPSCMPGSGVTPAAVDLAGFSKARG